MSLRTYLRLVRPVGPISRSFCGGVSSSRCRLGACRTSRQCPAISRRARFCDPPAPIVDNVICPGAAARGVARRFPSTRRAIHSPYYRSRARARCAAILDCPSASSPFGQSLGRFNRGSGAAPRRLRSLAKPSAGAQSGARIYQRDHVRLFSPTRRSRPLRARTQRHDEVAIPLRPRAAFCAPDASASHRARCKGSPGVFGGR